MKIIIKWLKANSIMLMNASSLVGTTAITSGLGFVYWWIVARWFSPDAIGIASASVSAMILLGSASMLGLGTLLITELPRQPEQAGSMICTALIVVGVGGSVVGLIFATTVSHISPGFRPLNASLIDTLTFSGGVGLTAVTLVLDQALIGLLKGGLQFWRNTFFAVVKLLALLVVGFWPSHQEGMRIYATWMVSSAFSLGLILIYLLAKPAWRSKDYFPRWVLMRKLGLTALQHHFLNLTLQAPTLLLPVLVTTLLSARMNAWFYVSWMIVSFVFIVPGALTTVLHAMNSAQQSTLGRKARLTIGIAFAISLLANLILQVGAKQVLGLFGHTYADQAAWTLRILVIAAFPLIIKNHYISFCRIQDRVVQAMIGTFPSGLLELGAATLGAHFAGLFGLSLGWLFAISVEAICMLPTVYKVIKSEPRKEENIIIEVEKDIMPLLSVDNMARNSSIWLVDTLLLPSIGIAYGQFSQEPLLNSQKKFARLKPPKLQHYISDEKNSSSSYAIGDIKNEKV